MYYEALAGELLNARAQLLQVPAHQEIAKLMRGELFVLNHLKNSERPIHPKELSEKLSVSTARIARLLNHLEEQKLIVRFTDERDSRQVNVQLTELGISTIDKARKKVLEYTAQMLESLGPNDAKEYIRIQEKIYQTYLSKISSDK